MIYETYTCVVRDNAEIEFGYCFMDRVGEEANDLPDIPLGLVRVDDPHAEAKMQAEWAEYEWMAKAICAAAPNAAQPS